MAGELVLMPLFRAPAHERGRYQTHTVTVPGALVKPCGEEILTDLKINPLRNMMYLFYDPKTAVPAALVLEQTPMHIFALTKGAWAE